MIKQVGLVLGVPYFSQWDITADDTKNDCGPASILAVLSYYDPAFKKTVDEVFQRTGAGQDYINFQQMFRAINSFGYDYSYVAGSTKEQITSLIDKEIPPIALIKYAYLPNRQDTGFGGPHFVTVVGYDERGVYIHDSNYWDERKNEGSRKYILWNDFLTAWSRSWEDKNPVNSLIIIYDQDEINLDAVVKPQQIISSGDRRPYWFDLIRNVVWPGVGHEKITDEMVLQFSKTDYPSRAKRAATFDEVCKSIGYKGNTTSLTAAQLLDFINDDYNEAKKQASKVPQLEAQVSQTYLQIEKEVALRIINLIKEKYS